MKKLLSITALVLALMLPAFAQDVDDGQRLSCESQTCLNALWSSCQYLRTVYTTVDNKTCKMDEGWVYKDHPSCGHCQRPAICQHAYDCKTKKSADDDWDWGWDWWLIW